MQGASRRGATPQKASVGPPTPSFQSTSACLPSAPVLNGCDALNAFSPQHISNLKVDVEWLQEATPLRIYN